MRPPNHLVLVGIANYTRPVRDRAITFRIVEDDVALSQLGDKRVARVFITDLIELRRVEITAEIIAIGGLKGSSGDTWLP